MPVSALPRLLLVGFTLSMITTGLMSAPAAAQRTTDWSEATSHENVLVQSCSDFDISSSYTTVRKYHVVEDYTGQTVYERRDVTFAGSVLNTTSGMGFGFDGGFVRIADYDQNTISISGLTLRFDPPGQGEVTVAIARQGHDLIDNPPAVLLEFAPFAQRNALCDLLAGSSDDREASALDLLDLLHPPAPDPCLVLPSGRPC